MTRPSIASGSGPTSELVALLLREIAGCGCEVGSLAPPEAVLQRRFGTTRYRLRQAMEALRKMGVVDSRPGIGTVILSKTPAPFFVQSQETLEGIVEAARSTRLRLKSAGPLPPGRRGEPRLPAGRRWWLIDTVRSMRRSSAPIGTLQLYVPAEFAGVRDHVEDWDGPVFKLIERLYGVSVASVEQEIDSCNLDARTARALDVPAGTAALKVTRHWLDAGGRLIQCSVGLYPKGRSRYRSRLQIGSA